MAAPFVCKDCGAPRQYINQYCPNCESIGPHIASSSSHKSKGKSDKDSVAKNRARQIDTFEDEFQYNKPRQEKVRPVKEPKPKKERAPRLERWSDPDDYELKPVRKAKPVSVSLPGRSWLVGGLIFAVAALVVLLVINNGNSGPNTGSNNPDTVSANQNTNTTAVTPNTNPSSSAAAVKPADKPVSTPATTPVATPPQPPKDTAMPKLVGAKPEVIADDTTVTIAWKTDENSRATVKYGTTPSCDFNSPDQSALKNEHSVYISSLTPDTLYYYRITAADEAGNSGVLVTDSFRTGLQSNTAPYVGSKAPEFSLHTLDGTLVSLGQYRGKKVILNFWASWCSPCKVELPHLQEIWDKYKNSSDVTVLTIAGSESVESEIVSFIKSKGFTFPVCLDDTESTFNRYDIISIPKTFFIDKNGMIRKVQLGMFTSPGEIEFILTSY